MIYNNIRRKTFSVSDMCAIDAHELSNSKWHEMLHVLNALKHNNIDISSIISIHLNIELESYIDIHEYYQSSLIIFSYSTSDKCYVLITRYDRSNNIKTNESAMLSYVDHIAMRSDLKNIFDRYIKSHIDSETSKLNDAIDINDDLKHMYII